MIADPTAGTLVRPTLQEAARAPRPAAAPPVPEPRDSVSSAPGRPERLSHFLREASRSSLQHLRFLSSVVAGELIGMAAGAAIFTPVALHAGNLMFMTGGAALTGAAGALAGYFVENSRKGAEAAPPAEPRPGASAAPSAAVSGTDALLAAGAALRAMPRFVYPTITGATATEKQVISEALDALPLKDATAVSTIGVVEGMGAQGIAGVAHSVLTHSRILLERSELAIPGWNKEVTTHEVGHTVDMREGIGPLLSASSRGGFGRPPFVSDYASTNRMEDFAESYVRYRTDPTGLKDFSAGKHEVIDRISQPGLGERLVDRPAVREAGRRIGDALGKVPHLRTALELAGGLLAPLQVHRGAEQLEQGYAENDATRKFQGKLTLAQGALLLVPGGAPLAVGAAAAHLVLASQVQAGMDPARANEVSNKVLAVALGPVGMIGSALAGELGKAGVDLDGGTAEVQAAGTQGSFLRGLLWTVGGMGVGSVAGAAVGTALGGVPGAILGSQVGRLGGAATGLAGYGVIRALQAEKVESQSSDLDLTRDDKIFLAKVAGGAVLGGGAGAVAGAMAGRLAGAALGAAIGGPAGAAIGGSAGRYLGMMGGSLLLGKAGAALGRALDDGAPTAS